MEIGFEFPRPEEIPAADPRRRIVATARQQLFSQGYAALTMDALSHELGMSKKTLYVHFRSKDDILDAVFAEVGTHMRARLDEVLGRPGYSFMQKLHAVGTLVLGMMGRLTPGLLRDLQRYSPRHYQQIERMRQQNIPEVFGRLIRDGIAEGRVRAEVDPEFAAQFWLQAVRGLVQPETLQRTGLTPRESVQQGLQLFFAGLLSPVGRKDYANQQRRESVA